MNKRNNLDYYDRWASEWWDETAKVYALNHLNVPRFAYFDRHIPNWQGLNVLDVGCGGGFTCEFLANRGAIVSGVDRSKDCLEAANNHAAAHQLAIDYYYAFAESLPFQDATFDVVTCVDVLEHVADLLHTLKEIHRVLKPGGIFCFDTINRTFKSKLIMIWLLEEILKEIPRGIHDWQKFIKPDELTQILDRIGFHSTEISGFSFFGLGLREYLDAYLHYRNTKEVLIYLNQDTSVMYIGKAVKV